MNKNKKNVYYVDQLLKKPVKDKKNKSTYPTTLLLSLFFKGCASINLVLMSITTSAYLSLLSSL